MVSYNGKPEPSSPQEKSTESSPSALLHFDPDRATDLESLPFISRTPGKRAKKPYNYWHVPPAESYTLANVRGEEFGLLFVHYLYSQPELVGANLLGHIVKDMNLDEDCTSKKGYAVGFFTYLETMLFCQSRRLDFSAECQRLTRRRQWTEGGCQGELS